MWNQDDYQTGALDQVNRCRSCGKSMPKDRKHTTCSDCLDLAEDSDRMYAGEWVPGRYGVMTFIPAVQTKTCGACGEDLPLDDFGVNRARADGLARCCRDCTRDASARAKQRARQRRVAVA